MLFTGLACDFPGENIGIFYDKIEKFVAVVTKNDYDKFCKGFNNRLSGYFYC